MHMQHGINRQKVIAISSGKGGVGKTLTSINLAATAARMGDRTLVIDGDLGLANVDVLLGLRVDYSIFEFLTGRLAIEDVAIRGPLGVTILPAGSGIAALQGLDNGTRERLMASLEAYAAQFDTVVIDTGAGISETVLSLNRMANVNLVVTTPEPHAITDAYALIKVLSECEDIPRIAVAVNQAKSEEEGRRVFERLVEVASRFLCAKLAFAGSIPTDSAVQKAIMSRRVMSENAPGTISGQGWIQCYHRLLPMFAVPGGNTPDTAVNPNNNVHQWRPQP
jgi:flagellar biosynthesis protein FlhG